MSFHNTSFNFKKKFRDARGVTFLELMIVISIFAIISTTVLLRFSVFSTSVSLQNLAQDIALKIEQAQNASINGVYPKLRQDSCAGQTCVQTQTPIAVGTWTPSYGVYFDISLASGVSHRSQFVYFYDRNSNGIFDDVIPPHSFDWNASSSSSTNSCGNGPDTECLDVITISSGEQITGLTKITGNPQSGGSVQTPANFVSVIFKRPFPDSYITDQNASGTINNTNSPQPNPERLDITLAGNNNSGVKVITVSPLGRISVNDVDQ